MIVYLLPQSAMAQWLGSRLKPQLRKPQPLQRERAWPSGAQIDRQGLALLRRFEPVPAHAEQSLREIERAVWRQVQVSLTANQFAALVSLTYSIGETALGNSPLLQQLNAGRYQAAAALFLASFNASASLLARRTAEQKLFLRQ